MWRQPDGFDSVQIHIDQAVRGFAEQQSNVVSEESGNL